MRQANQEIIDSYEKVTRVLVDILARIDNDQLQLTMQGESADPVKLELRALFMECTTLLQERYINLQGFLLQGDAEVSVSRREAAVFPVSLLAITPFRFF